MTSQSTTAISDTNKLDWDVVCTQKHTYNLSTLAHHACANVHPLTVHIGRLVSDSFHIAGRGDHNVSDAFNNLPCLDGGDWAFGFGLEHVARGAWSWGVLPGVLLEYYDTKFSANVMYELAASVGVPKEMRPSRKQWEGLMVACNGVLAACDLGLLIANLVRLNPYNTVIDLGLKPGSNGPVRRHANTESIGQALASLSALSRGKKERITIMGVNDVGWLAAVSEWLLDMRITIKDMDGKTLHSNFEGQGKESQIDFIFEDKGKDLDKELARLRLKDGENFVHLIDSSQQDSCVENGVLIRLPPVLGGRTEWGGLFRAVYGHTFVSLIETEAPVFGTSVACAARVLQGIKDSDPGVPESLCAASWLSNPSSYGSGLVQTMTGYFIGMSRALSNMQHCLKLSVADATARYEEQLVKLAKYCGCDVCVPESKVRKEYCQLAMVESVITLGIALSRMIVAPHLFPRGSGIRLVYNHQVRVLRTIQEGKLTGLERIARAFQDTFQAKEGLMLQVCCAIFGGVSVPPQVDPHAQAMMSNGICSCMGLLYKLSGRHAEKVDVRIVPGTIQYCGRLYDRVIAYDGFEPDVSESKSVQEMEDRVEVIVPEGMGEPLLLRRRAREGNPTMEGNGKA